MRVRPYLMAGFSFLSLSYRMRYLVLLLARKNLQLRYAGSGIGVAWAIANPVMMILVYWFVFSFGFRVQPVGDAPFIIVFLCGFVPWTTFSEVLLTNVGAITSNPHLVKKTVFNTEVLAVANWLASTVTHAVMLLMVLFVLLASGRSLTTSSLQLMYHFFGLSVLSLGMSWLLASLNVFYRGFGAILGVTLNAWFWLTPIVWFIDMIPEHLRWIVELNPMYFVVRGYQAALVYNDFSWASAGLTAYFWVVTLLFFVGGAALFRRLQPEFADAI